MTPEEKKEKSRQWTKESNRRLKRYVLFLYSGSDKPFCRCCGEDNEEFLTLDHIQEDGNIHRKELKMGLSGKGGGMNLYRWARDNFPNNRLQVLCYNCNCAKSYFGECPHERNRRGG